MRRERGTNISDIRPHGQRWRFVVRSGAGRTSEDRQIFSYPTEQEAKTKRAAMLRQIEADQAVAHAMTWRQAIEAFCKHLEHERGVAARSAETAEGRLRRFWRDLDQPARATVDGGALYKDLRTRPRKQTGQPVSVQEHRLCLRIAKQMAAWMVEEKHWNANPVAKVKPIGTPRRGEESKAQLMRDELWTLVKKSLDLGEKGDAGAAATLCCAVLGLRASTVANRRRRHLDAHGTILQATAKKKTVDLSLVGQTPEQEQVMSRLRRVLALQARGKLPEAHLIGLGVSKADGSVVPHDRWWVRREVNRLCELAGVPVVPPHGLRGTFQSVGRQLQIAPGLLAGALSHSEAVAERHYATSASVAAGQQGAVLQVLVPGRSKDDPAMK